MTLLRTLEKTTVAVLLLGTAVGCQDGLSLDLGFGKTKGDPEEGFVKEEPDEIALANSLAYRDTVGQQGWIEGLRYMRVRGYGIVAGLGTRGSRECPTSIRDRLLQEMYKRPEFSGAGLEPARITPEEVLDSLDTAVVMIEGEIPAAAVKGTRFDVTVRALPGTQTTSLEGGRLFTAPLQIYRDIPSGRSVEGKTLALAEGQVFINPFADEDEATTERNPREGQIIGGGINTEPRRLRLVLNQPSYQRVQQIARVINSRFPYTEEIAEPTSPSYADLRIPATFQDDAFHFLALVRHLYLSEQQGFADRRARALAEEVLDPSAPHPDIALAWEGIGRTALPVVQELYTAPAPHARFYAALAGLRLEDGVAVDVIERIAKDEDSPYRLVAIEELGRAQGSPRAAGALRRLLDHSDPRIRVAAYEGLLMHDDRSISTKVIGQDNFALDSVASSGNNLIYVRRSVTPRIALLGSTIRCQPPVLYVAPDNMIMVSADEGDTELTLIRRTPFNNLSSPPLPGPLEVAELIDMLGDDPQVNSMKEVHGLALDYSSITHLLYELCRQSSINAAFMLQRVSVQELLGPPPAGRAESDL